MMSVHSPDMSHARALRAGMAGFTLMELMIVFSIIAVIAAVAYPSYTSYIQSTRQSEVQGQLMDLANGLEGYRAKRFSYKDAGTAPVFTASDANGNQFYDVTLGGFGATNQSYVITATPKTSGMMAGTEEMKLDSQGRTCIGDPNCTIGTDNSWKE
jgi:type IV pilus assembly protein PilE